MTKKMTNHFKALNFWMEFNSEYPHSRVDNWMDEMAEGADWFRNLSLTDIAIAAHCENRVPGSRVATFDEKKQAAGRLVVKQLLKKYDLTQLMQN